MYYFWVTGGCYMGKRWADIPCVSSLNGHILGAHGVLWPFPCPWPGSGDGRSGSDGQTQDDCHVQYCNNTLFLCMFLVFSKALVPQGGEMPGSSGIRQVHIAVSVLILWCLLACHLPCAWLTGWYGQTQTYPWPLPPALCPAEMLHSGRILPGGWQEWLWRPDPGCLPCSIL